MPSLDEIAADPSRARALPPDAVRSVTLLCATILAALATVPPAPHGDAEAGPPDDRLLDVKETAQRLGTSTDYLYRHGRTLPFTVRVGSRLRFSSRGIDRYIRSRQGR